MSALERYFSSAGFIPHGYCLLWRPDVLALHTLSDSIIAAAYFSIPLAIAAFVRRRPDLAAEHRRVAVLFATFILGCGLTHVFGVIVLWRPLYVEDGLIKAFTALVSIITAAALWPMLPRLLQIPSPSQLEQTNAKLQAEVAARREAIAALERARAGLEVDVARRTREVEVLARRFELATEGSVISLAELDADLRFTWMHNPRPPFDRLQVGEHTQGRLGPSAPALIGAPIRAVLSSRQPLSTEVTLPVDGAEHSFEIKITPSVVADGQPGVLVAAVDITEQKRQQAHMQVVMRELAHRAKNLLSLVDGIARQSARADGLPVALVDGFSARLASLGDAYDLVISDDWKGAGLTPLIEGQLAFIASEARARLRIHGPSVTVSPEAAQYLALALHELATNATKYGALNTPDGRIAVVWRLALGETGDVVTLEWRETGLSEPPKPARSGFGRSLLDRIVPRALGGEGGLDFGDYGVVWRVVFPL
ncbi:sensor histidine kinase [Caulobacter sp. KR2-114]|uniref:sensor histidine kinase n=1 Tax=Caulobacter sp. KR2-114 TaxID=3400912 RepID=UPI003C10C27A